MRFDRCADLAPYALGRVTEHEIKRYIVAADLDVLQGFAAGEIFPGVRVDQIFQCALYIGFAKTHYSLLKSYKKQIVTSKMAAACPVILTQWLAACRT